MSVIEAGQVVQESMVEEWVAPATKGSRATSAEDSAPDFHFASG